MATIRRRRSSWQVQVRRDGFPALSKSFDTKAAALSWAREKERAIERLELPIDYRQAGRLTVGDLLRRYQKTVTPTKRGSRSETSRIRTLLAHPVSTAPLSKLTPASVAHYRDDRLNVVSGDAVRRELSILRHCLNLAKQEWDAPLASNPVLSITLPEPSKARDKRLDEGQDEKLDAAIGQNHAWYLRPLVGLAIETGMRRGELLSLTWANINFEKRTAYLPETKNGHVRTIALTSRAKTILCDLPRFDARVFPMNGNAVRLAWDRLRVRAGLQDLRFHDLRHEAISRFFELGLSVPEVALISGHRDTRMLMRYTHLRPCDVAKKLP
ncbi:tyrosine-type recombinase/integrase [Methylobacterium mesophilicum]